MIPGVAARARIVPGKSLVDVGSPADIVASGIGIASKDVDEPRAEASHGAPTVASFAPVWNW